MKTYTETRQQEFNNVVERYKEFIKECLLYSDFETFNKFVKNQTTITIEIFLEIQEEKIQRIKTLELISSNVI